MSKLINIFAWGVLMLSAAGAEAAVCTSKATGSWSVASTWTCVGTPIVTIPGATDTAIIASPNTVTLAGSIPVINLTVDVGGALADGGRTLTITGNLTNNGTISGGGNMNVTGAASVIFGTGTFTNSRLYTSGASPSIASGSAISFTGSSRLYTGRTQAGATVAGSVLTINGTINSTVTTASTTFLRLYATSTVVGTTGVINAAVSAVTYNTATATLTNNGSVSVDKITQNAASNVWTQGVNSNLSVTSVTSVGTFNAHANGNTVTYNGTSTVIPPSAGYWNLAGTIFPGACPVAYMVSGSNPCPAGGPVSVTLNPSNCVNVTGIGTLAWATPANAVATDNVYSTVSLNDLQVCNYLRCTGYGFAIPAGATINGITVNVERRASNTNSVRDAAMRLVRDAAGLPVIQTTDRSTLTNYTTADVVQAHGGVADLWGGTWTATDINSANFGAAFASQKPATVGGARTVRVDHMPITVSYTTSVFHHASINAPATAMTSTEVPVVIAPHNPAHGAVTAVGTINLSTSTGTGNWTIGSGTGTLTPGAADSGLASYTFGAGESSATLGFTSLAAGTLNLNVAFGGTDMLLNTPAGEKANTITFSIASFVFTSSACTHNVAFGTPGQCVTVTWSPRTAGLALANVYITSVNAAGVPTRLHPTLVRTRNMQFGLSCLDPVANAGVQASFSATAVALPLCQANGAPPATWTAGVDLSFAGGSPSVGPYSFNYDDVGEVELWMRNSAATAEVGSSGHFVVKPAGFTLSNIRRSSDGFANPGAVNAGGAAFVKAGETFTLSVTALNASGIATPNYGKEVIQESVKLTPTLVAGLGLTNNPAVNGGFGLFAGGVATGIAFKWSEVGIITLTPSVGDADYLGVGEVTGTSSGNIGRFSLGKFALQNAALDERADYCQGGFLADGVTACAPTFTYMGEQIDANFTLVPMSLNDIVVQNYVDSATPANDFAKLVPSTFADLNLAAVDTTSAGGPFYLTGRISGAAMPVATCATALCFQTGSADVNVPFTLSRGVTADGVYGAVDIGIAPVDTDGARVEGAGATAGLCNNPSAVDCYDLDADAITGNEHALLGTTAFRYGRTHIDNTYGSELLELNMPIKLEYWNGSAYVVSVDDTLSFVTLVLGNYLVNLNAGETLATAPTFVNGVGQIRLSAPGAGNNGSVDVTLGAPSSSYLSGGAGRATFGVYKGSKEFIYLREAY